MNKDEGLIVVKLQQDAHPFSLTLINEIRMRKNVIFKSTLFLLTAFYVFVGCQKDDALTPQQQNEEQHAES